MPILAPEASLRENKKKPVVNYGQLWVGDTEELSVAFNHGSLVLVYLK